MCECRVCQRSRKFQEVLERAPEQDKEFWKEIFNTLYDAESSRDYWQAKAKGEWPT